MSGSGRLARALRVVLALLLLVVTALTLAPVDYLPPQSFDFWDKAQHAIAFAVLGLAGLLAFPRRPWAVLIGMVVYGGAIELAQHATGWRYGDWADWIADIVGLTAAALVWLPFRPRRAASSPDGRTAP